ncbi:MAG: Rv2578c family radical SAM protein [Solirubrobacterales bacterium]
MCEHVFVRWESQQVDRERERRLPRLGDDAVVRTFDAPEALDIRFHEVRAKSALNAVPKQSRMPFRWTINPYRGCSHACAYCSHGETPILMYDGHTKPLAEVRVGDEVYGTVGEGRRRRFVASQVLAHWETSKSGVRTILEDDTELLTSGDHRFLTPDGWRFVSGPGHDRPVLAPRTGLMGGVKSTPRLSIAGNALRSDERLRVRSAEPTGQKERLYDITTTTGDFIANGVVSHNCFARPTHNYLDLDAGRDFEREIVVKVNLPEVLRTELAKPSWKREQVALGTNTDPYQWVESRYKLMPEIWRALLDFDTPCSLVTKSPLAVRDIDVLQDLAAGPGVTVFFSVPTLDEHAWRTTEPHTPSPRARLEGVRKMNEAGVPSGILIAPLMPGINDSPEEVGKILRIAEDAGAISAPAMALHLRPGVKEVFFEWMQAHRPDLMPRYEELYGNRSYVPSAEKKRIAEVVDSVRPPRSKRRPRGRPAGRRPPRGLVVDPQKKELPAESAQATLF